MQIQTFLNENLKKVELEKTEKTQKVQSRYQIIISETWTLYLILNTWVVEDIWWSKKSWFIWQKSKLDSNVNRIKKTLPQILRPIIHYRFHLECKVNFFAFWSLDISSKLFFSYTNKVPFFIRIPPSCVSALLKQHPLLRSSTLTRHHSHFFNRIILCSNEDNFSREFFHPTSNGKFEGVVFPPFALEPPKSFCLYLWFVDPFFLVKKHAKKS